MAEAIITHNIIPAAFPYWLSSVIPGVKAEQVTLLHYSVQLATTIFSTFSLDTLGVAVIRI